MGLTVEVLTGNIVEVPADVLISTANPWLQMTGGVNLAIMVRSKGEDVYEELQQHLRATGSRSVEPGSVIRTGPGSLPVHHILHAVSIDPSYDSSIDLVTKTLERALSMAQQLDASTVTLAALATGFGPLSMEDFTAALNPVLEKEWPPIALIKVVVKHEEEAERIRAALLPV